MARLKPSYLYLIHFSRKLEHAQHYIGVTEDLHTRLANHATGRGANILWVCKMLDIAWEVSRVWRFRNDDKFFQEGLIKAMKNGPKFCPICNPCLVRCYNSMDSFPLDLISFPITSKGLLDEIQMRRRTDIV